MAKGDEVKRNQDIAGRPFAEIEGLLESLPYGPEEVPIGAEAQAHGLCQSDFVKHEADARAALAALDTPPAQEQKRPMKQAFRRLNDNDKTEMMRGLNWVAIDVEQNWLTSDYPASMRSDVAQFRHAHVHAMKALGEIAALVDHADHQRQEDEEAKALVGELPKLLADLVRCTAKMAETAPIKCDLGTAYYARSEQLSERWTNYRDAQEQKR